MNEQQNSTDKKTKTTLTPEQKKAKLEADIARKKQQLAALAEKDRKRQTRDKILVGSLIFALAAKGHNLLDQLLKFAETYEIKMTEKDKTRLEEINTELENKAPKAGQNPETQKTQENPKTPKAGQKAGQNDQKAEKAKNTETLSQLFSSEKKPLAALAKEKREAQTTTTQAMNVEQEAFNDA